MVKQKTVFYCQNCGVQSPKWMGKCTSCGEWNTFAEEVVQKESGSQAWTRLSTQPAPVPIPIDDIPVDAGQRIKLYSEELNRVLGGGLVAGSVVLIGGEPGIGKSTLMLQLALNFGNRKVLYITGEESVQQVKMRADRIGIRNPNCYILAETNTQAILQHLEKLAPDLVIVDSVQTLETSRIESTAGSISQIRECAAELQRYAKLTGKPLILIGHITKDGFIAGPKVLEHMVDTVLQFEGDRNHMFRILRAAKNRFGPTSELGIFEMRGSGLEEVANPSDILISQRDEMLGGVSIAATIEGLRTLLIETQALVGHAVYGTPQRSSTGYDLRRLNMILAVLEKKMGFKLGTKDVFLNIAGGIRVDDPAIDLSVVTSIISSLNDIPVSPKKCYAAEVGLSGEIRPVSRIEQRIGEAEKLGFDEIFISKYNLKGVSTAGYTIRITPLTGLKDAITAIFK